MKMLKVLATQSCPTLCDPMDYTHSSWISPGQNTGVGCLSLLQGNLPNPRIELGSPVLPADPLLSEPTGKSPVGMVPVKSSPGQLEDAGRARKPGGDAIYPAYSVLWLQPRPPPPFLSSSLPGAGSSSPGKGARH